MARAHAWPSGVGRWGGSAPGRQTGGARRLILCACSVRQVSPMLRGLTLLAALTGASASAVELTPDNFDKEVTQSGKAAFIKFLAPW